MKQSSVVIAAVLIENRIWDLPYMKLERITSGLSM
jgi:hypothetical protein